MEPLNVINLIQFATSAITVLGSFLLWRVKQFRGIALNLICIALASIINIIEEVGLINDGYLVSPIFIMLFGPTTYLASKFAIERQLTKYDGYHLLPIVPLIFFTSYIHIVIAVGTIWRLIYTCLTANLLLKYKKNIDQLRSDSDDYSLNWLVILLCVMALFNLIDLIRLNLQPFLTIEINLLGQGINNFAWLIASMIIIYQFSGLNSLPKPSSHTYSIKSESLSQSEHYKVLYEELDSQMREKQWYLTPRITLAIISDFTGLQTRDISRAINLHAEKSFNEYINHFRVQNVCEQLKVSSEDSLTHIAFGSGFSSKASFNKVFKQIIGTTPSEYKSSLKS